MSIDTVIDREGRLEGSILTIGFDIAMYDTLGMEIRKAFQHLHGIDLYDVFVLDTSKLQESCQASALTILLKDVDFVSVHFDPIVLDDVGMT